MSKEKDKTRAASPPSYGTFQGVPTYPPPLYPHPPSRRQVTGFPQPSPPPGAPHHDLSVHQYIQEHQTVLVCSKINPREKPGYIACTIAAVLATNAIVFGLIEGRDWS